MVERPESVGKLWAAGKLSMAYPHGSARVGPQDSSTSPPAVVGSFSNAPCVSSAVVSRAFCFDASSR